MGSQAFNPSTRQVETGVMAGRREEYKGNSWSAEAEVGGEPCTRLLNKIPTTRNEKPTYELFVRDVYYRMLSLLPPRG